MREAHFHRPLIPNATYFITAVAERRRRLFADGELAGVVVEQWRHYQGPLEFHLDAYVVMPDHCHVVLTTGEQHTIAQIVHAVHSYTATLINARWGLARKRAIWQRPYWDEVIRDEAMYWEKVAYVLLNPWRAGLVREPTDPYPFSNLQEWVEREGGEFVAELLGRYRRRGE